MTGELPLAQFTGKPPRAPRAGVISALGTPGSHFLLHPPPPQPPSTPTTPVLSGGGSSIAIAGPGGGPALEIRNSTLDATALRAPLIRVSGTNLATRTLLLVDPSSLALSHNLLSLSSASLTGTDDILVVLNSTITSTITASGARLPLVGVASSTVSGAGALLSLEHSRLTAAGPILNGTGSIIGFHGPVLRVGAMSTVATAGGPAISLSSGQLTADAAASISGRGRLSLGGPLLSLSSGAPTATFGGAVLRVAGGTVTGPPTGMLFGVRGTATAVDAESGLTLGTDRPLRAGGALLQATAGAVTAGRLLALDTALLQASAPLLHLTANSTMTASRSVFNLGPRANVTSSAGALVRLDGSQATITTGALFAVAGGSKLKTTAGDLLQMDNGARLTLSNGVLLNVAGGSFASITGALVRFGGSGGNVLSVTNSLRPTGFLNGIPVFSSLGRTTGFTITNPTPLAGLNTLGTIRINGVSCTPSCAGASGSLIAITGIGGTVRIR